MFKDDDDDTNDATDSPPSTDNQTDCAIPSLEEFAKSISKKEGKEMDDKQYITYETICATFLLGLVNDASNK